MRTRPNCTAAPPTAPGDCRRARRSGYAPPWPLVSIAFATFAAFTVLAAGCRDAGEDDSARPPATPASAPAARDEAKRVLIVSIDGLRPDLLARGRTPHIRALLDVSSYTFWARTDDDSWTIPCHVSMLTGVTPERHGVTWNDHVEGAYANVPTLFELAKRHALSTAMAVGKTKFVVLDKPGTVDWKFLPRDEPIPEARVADEAVRILRDHRPRVLFVHFGGVDYHGHMSGWGSDRQRAALEAADAGLGRVLGEATALGLRGNMLVILTADHGGAGLEHNPGDVRNLFVPWVVSGPGIRKGYDLTRNPRLFVRIQDTFATAASFLGLPLAPDLDGKPVADILQDRPLLYEVPAGGLGATPPSTMPRTGATP